MLARACNEGAQGKKGVERNAPHGFNLTTFPECRPLKKNQRPLVYLVHSSGSARILRAVCRILRQTLRDAFGKMPNAARRCVRSPNPSRGALFLRHREVAAGDLGDPIA